jgi:hypothetical protein
MVTIEYSRNARFKEPFEEIRIISYDGKIVIHNCLNRFAYEMTNIINFYEGIGCKMDKKTLSMFLNHQIDVFIFDTPKHVIEKLEKLQKDSKS